MPEFRFSGTLDGVPADLRPGDGRVGAALSAAPVIVSGQTIRLDRAFDGTLQALRNLGDVQDRAAARSNLDLGSAALLTAGTAAGNVPGLGGGGKVSATILPAIAITDTFVVASQSAMLALTAERGDVAVRTDLNKSFVLQAEPASTLANWIELRSPTAAVLSVAGLTGAITAPDLRSALGLGTGNAPTFAGLRTTGGGDIDYRQAQALMSGGGTISWAGNGGKLKWTDRFICMPLPVGSASNTYIDINQPTTNIPAAQVSDGAARTADANGVVLNTWDALYAVHTVGGGPTDITFRIVSNGATFVAPPNWLLVAAVNGDGTCKLGTGHILRSGQTRNYTVKESYVIAEVTGLPSALGGFRNRLVNGALLINQRGAASSSTSYAAGAYILDRWKAGPGGVTLSFSMAANGDVTVTITAGTLLQVIEGALYAPEGGTYVLSWSGTATGRVYQGTASGAYAASPIANTALTAGANTTVEFGAGTIARAQFEIGALPTRFEYRDDEMRRCQRYYQTGSMFLATGNQTYVGGQVLLFVLMRGGSPTLTWSDGAGNANRIATASGGTNVALSAGGPFATAALVRIDAVPATAPGSWAFFAYNLSSEL